MVASKYSFLGGFEGTSNVYAGYLFGVPISGTHAHSFVMSYSSEDDIKDHKTLDGIDILEKALNYRKELQWEDTEITELYAFISYAVSFPNSFLGLVDSYSTLGSGVKNFLVVTLAIHDLGYHPLGIRLDSGDLAQLASESKKMFREVEAKYGKDLSFLKVVASNDINEETIKKLNDVNH